MAKSFKKNPLYPIANPKSIAFFGASNNFRSMGTMLLASLLGSGYLGKIYPVHLKETEVQGLKAYHSIHDLPETPDLAIMILPNEIVAQMLEEFGKKGLTHVIIISGGFKEIGGEGIELEKEIKEIADRYSIRILGPNCIGVSNPHQKMNPTPFPLEGPAGFIGIASQSGSFITQMINYLARLQIGFSTGFSIGNAVNTDLVDCLRYFEDCPHTRVIALYVEGIPNGKEFIEVARSVAAKKPIVAYYIGGSEAGKRAGFSHTGSMAGPDELYEGMFRQAGIIRAHSISELFDFCWALGQLPKPGGNQVVIQSHSGGPGASAADACCRAGLDVAPLSAGTREKLTDLVPHTGSVNNPVDLTFFRNPEDFFSAIPNILLEDQNTDILMIYFLSPESMMLGPMERFGINGEEAVSQVHEMFDRHCNLLADLMKKHPKPIVGFSFRNLGEYLEKNLIKRGLPVFPDPQRAAAALNALITYHQLQERLSVED